MLKIIIKRISVVLFLIGVIFSLQFIFHFGMVSVYAAVIGGTSAGGSTGATELTHTTENLQIYTGIGAVSEQNVFKFNSDIDGDCTITFSSENLFSYRISGDGIFANMILSSGDNISNINYNFTAAKNHMYFIKIYSDSAIFIADINISVISSLIHNVTGGVKTFSALNAGYIAGTQEAALTVTMTGIGPNTNVNAAVSGVGANGFTLVENINNLADHATGTFTVRPKNNLTSGTYLGIVTITSDEFPEGVSFSVTQVVNTVLVHDVVGGVKTFNLLTVGYIANSQEAALTVTMTGKGANTEVNAVLSGIGASGFDLVENINDLADNATGTFTVRPKNNLTVGIYNATVTITSHEFQNGVSFSISQTVSAAPSSLTNNLASGVNIFSPLTVGYSPGTIPAPLIFLVKSIGINTGVNVVISGDGAAGFDITQNTYASIIDNVILTFSIRTKAGLAVGTYCATVTITSIECPEGTAFTVTQVVKPALFHNIHGIKTFSQLTVGYDDGTQEAPLTVTVTAIGNNTAVSAALSGPDPEAFDLVESINNLANNANGTFSVRAKNDLPVGIYYATVTITSAEFPQGIFFTISQTVIGLGTSLIHNVPGDIKILNPLFAGSQVGIENLAVYVRSIGATKEISVAFSGAGVNGFDVNNNLRAEMASEEVGTIFIRAKSGLAPGTYTITVTITHLSAVTSLPSSPTSFTVIQVVKPILYHDVPNRSKRFSPVSEGYTADTQETLTVKVTAIGANSFVTATLSGLGAGRFELIENISNLANNTTGTFTVRPKNGLTQGTYNATVTITSSEFPTGVNFEVIEDVAALPSPPPLTPRSAIDSSALIDLDGVSNIADLLSSTQAIAAIGSQTTITTGSVTTTTVLIDDKKIEDKLSNEGENSTIVIPIDNHSNIVVGQLNGNTLKNMENKEAILEIKTENVTYTLPASGINIDQVSSQLGEKVELKDITVSITIGVPSSDMARIVADTAEKNSYNVIIKPVEFEITCTSGGKTVEISKFNGYVERLIAVPEGVDPSKITTGIVLNKDGTFSPVPTSIVKIDGKYFVKINSLTNSIYSIIWNPVTFADIQKHRAKGDIEDMASRLIMSGVDKDRFAPDKEITRGEFVNALVKTIGLLRTGTGKDIYIDVGRNNPYYDAISIANEYKIIEGYGDHSFRPDQKISREEAMKVVASAMAIMKLEVKVSDYDIKKILSKFIDGEKVAGWAKRAVAICYKNQIVIGFNSILSARKNMTKAETATCLHQLLQKFNLN